MPLQRSFCTIAYRHYSSAELERMLPEIAELGYQGAEVWWPHLEKCTPGRLQEISSLAKSLNLTFPMISPYLGNFNLEMTNREEMIERTKVSAPVAVALGSPLLRAFAGWTCECSSLTASEEYWKYNLEGFKEMAQIAEAHGLNIAIETHDMTLADSVAGVQRFVDFCGPALKANLQLDTITENSKLADGAAVYHALGELVVHAHFHPTLDDADKHADHKKLVQAMLKDDFKGYVSIENCSGKGEPAAVGRSGQQLLAELSA